MNAALSANTQAILLLTAPLISGRSDASPDLLTPGEYKRFARHLHQLGREPADLLTVAADEIVRESSPVIDPDRIKRLLGRGFALSQAIERWQSRAIWVVSRADSDYPQRLRERLKEDRPAVIYGCGERSILDSGGLAVVGSRAVDEALVEYTEAVGLLAARARRTLVSGGARGIDQAAMRSALAAGGRVTGVLADSLEKTAMNREHRAMLMDGQLVLISPYDPGAGFNVGNAMQRNKLIYAFADAALVVNSDFEKGGTWAGAVEQLNKFKFIPVFVRSTGSASKGLEALARKGALPWPNPEDQDAFEEVFNAAPDESRPAAPQESLFAQEPQAALALPASDVAIEAAPEVPNPAWKEDAPNPSADKIDEPAGQPTDRPSGTASSIPAPQPGPDDTMLTPAEALFAAVRDCLPRILTIPKKEAEIASELQVTPAQARDWLHRLLEEGAVEKGPKKSLYQLPGGLL
jgi:predicted Rossmann fold nucleotide-binding protein DprA/Smf involved in DNA uptake